MLFYLRTTGQYREFIILKKTNFLIVVFCFSFSAENTARYAEDHFSATISEITAEET
jgi:hypothetical protein